ncbi:hypothetical protein ADUPG1_008555 [Aduncisulcus paluster]|uniref:Kinetochore protein SPC25 n=1 Tax=Aduncisulcus paluster TaxID=2918883 RepID=A0ABQ5KUR7_9EUKA|nr:hypothetical protein ADUPG1_008555 [Aduncisulcus paluster]
MSFDVITQKILGEEAIFFDLLDKTDRKFKKFIKTRSEIKSAIPELRESLLLKKDKLTQMLSEEESDLIIQNKKEITILQAEIDSLKQEVWELKEHNAKDKDAIEKLRKTEEETDKAHKLEIEQLSAELERCSSERCLQVDRVVEGLKYTFRFEDQTPYFILGTNRNFDKSFYFVEETDPLLEKKLVDKAVETLDETGKLAAFIETMRRLFWNKIYQ